MYFDKYLKDQLSRLLPIRQDGYVLLLLDGHKTHLSTRLLEWAEQNKVIIHIIPAIASKILQSLNTGDDEQMSTTIINEQKKSSSNHSMFGMVIKAYQSACSIRNLQSSFARTGIYPLDENKILLNESVMETFRT